MDSLTQAVLGGAIMGALVGRKHGRKAVLAGVICGTLPDLDVFIPYGDDLSNMVEHRGFSHSLLFLTLVSPLFVWMFSKIHWFGFDVHDKKLHVALWFALITHPLLDTMTIYGTQLFWPITQHPFGIGSVFIIDPMYTLPLLVCFIVFLWNKNINVMRFGLVFSTVYLIWSVFAQYQVTNIAKRTLDSIDSSQIMALPTPFNTVLWRVLVMDDNAYRVGYYSLFDKTPDIQFQSYKNITTFPKTYDVNRLKDFTKGFYGVVKIDNKIIMQDLRMGLEPNDYVFQFVVGKDNAGQIIEQKNQQYRAPRNTKTRIKKLWDRIWNEDIQL